MSRFITADLHLGHENICNGKLEGTRPFVDYQEMDEAIVENWNSRVRPRDIVYVLGDVAFGITKRDSLRHLPRMNGSKVLVMGNHDYRADIFVDYFAKIMAYKDLKIAGRKVVMSHIPIHPVCLDRWDLNLHGHLHGNTIEGDNRYICVSMEQNKYHPFSEMEIESIIEERGL